MLTPAITINIKAARELEMKYYLIRLISLPIFIISVYPVTVLAEQTINFADAATIEALNKWEIMEL